MFSTRKLIRPFIGTLVLAMTASMNYGQKGEAKTDTEVYEAIGVMFAHGSGLARMNFTDAEVESILKGLRKGLATKEIPAEVEALQPKIQAIMQAKMETARAEMQKEQEAAAAKNKLASQKYFDDLAQKPGVKKDPSGFYYEILKEGTGKSPTMQDTVKLHYHGTLTDGTVFDSSVKREQPATFPMGGVIKGFSGGLTHVKVGGKIRIHIPSELGYGNNPRPGGVIKPGDTLIFECELLEIQ
jgi:FKBP-type peptidyl-prolyl cis-trans isomerase